MERIREVYALDYLRGLSKTEEFTKALAASGKAKVESAVDMRVIYQRTMTKSPFASA